MSLSQREIIALTNNNYRFKRRKLNNELTGRVGLDALATSESADRFVRNLPLKNRQSRIVNTRK